MPPIEKAAFNLDVLVEQLKAAASGPETAKNIRSIMDETFSDPMHMANGMPEFPEDNVILYEDETISIWHCRFQPGVSVPPHDHQMSVTIGVYEGSERNDFYEAASGAGIQQSSSVVMDPGEVLSIGPTAIHSVTCIGQKPSCGIHVYLGPLSTVERSLFDVEENQQLPFTDEHYQRLTR